MALRSITLISLLWLFAYGCGNDSRSASETDAGATEDAATSTSEDAGPVGADTGAVADSAGSEDVVSGGPCDPLDDTCPDDQYCQLVDDSLRCIPNGTVAPDPGNWNPECPDGTCSRGGICMPTISGFVEMTCYQPCDPDQEWSETGCFNGRHTCYPATDSAGNELDFGLCEYE